MKYFVPSDSIVRKIWGKSDTILFVFAGAAAEFALNKAVDWLYFTGKLPADPLGRLFSTARYARWIVFSSEQDAVQTLDTLRKIHGAVESKRGQPIPDWAYRDVLFMLIYYSIVAYELLEHRLSEEQKEEVYQVFFRVGKGMGLQELPPNYREWLPVRERHLRNDLQRSVHTGDLLRQYKKHLGGWRYGILQECQKLVVPDRVRVLLGFSKARWLRPLVPVYKVCSLLRLDRLLRILLVPAAYSNEVKELEVHTEALPGTRSTSG